MPRKRFTPEQILQNLREREVLLSQDKTIAQDCNKFGITDQRYYRWRKKSGGVRTDQAKRRRAVGYGCLVQRETAGINERDETGVSSL